MIAAVLGALGSSALPWLAGLFGGIGIVAASFLAGYQTATSAAKAAAAARDAEASAAVAAAQARMAQAQVDAPEDEAGLRAVLRDGGA